jgi:4-carboxymuconolactone decarboxylase
MSDDGEDRRSAAMAERRAVLGDAHVDRSMADDSPGAQEFQNFITEFAWGVWARGILTRRERSILVLGITAALGRNEEFSLHLRGARRNGLSQTDLDEIVLQIAAYAGAPAGVNARRAVAALREEEAQQK